MLGQLGSAFRKLSGVIVLVGVMVTFYTLLFAGRPRRFRSGQGGRRACCRTFAVPLEIARNPAPPRRPRHVLFSMGVWAATER